MKIKDYLRRPIPKRCCKKIIRISYSCQNLFSQLKYLIVGKKITDVSEIPVFINNYNRLSYLSKLIISLEKAGIRNIHIIDNASTYPPLLEYYKQCPYEVIYLKENMGYLSFWKTDLYKKYGNSYYVYTDPDLVLDEDCPSDFLEYFYKTLRKYPTRSKVGFGLRIDDIPECNPLKNDIIKQESQFWKKEIESGLYDASIDTTFALYRPFCNRGKNRRMFAIRTGYPYIMRHLPWYINPNNVSEEDKYYMESNIIATHWTRALKEFKELEAE